jgi:hypothetical protein
MTTLVAEYIASLNPAVQSFLAAGFCAAALVCLTSAGILATFVLDKISNSLVKYIDGTPGASCRPSRAHQS